MASISFGAKPWKKKTWWRLASRYCWNSARSWHASELVSFLVGLRTYQHPSTYGQWRKYTQGSPVQIQTPTQWNLIGRSLTAPPTVAQQCSSASFASLRCRFRKEKSGAFQKFYFFLVFTFELQDWNMERKDLEARRQIGELEHGNTLYMT